MILKNLTPVSLASHLEEVASNLRAETVTLYDAIRRLANDFAGWEEELDDEEEDWEGEEEDDEEEDDDD